MPLFLLSHNSRDTAEVLALRARLDPNVWGAPFFLIWTVSEASLLATVGPTPAPGRQPLRCRAAPGESFLAGLGTARSRREFHLAQRLNERIVVLLVEDHPIEGKPSEPTERWQVVSPTSGNDHYAARAPIAVLTSLSSR